MEICVSNHIILYNESCFIGRSVIGKVRVLGFFLHRGELTRRKLEPAERVGGKSFVWTVGGKSIVTKR